MVSTRRAYRLSRLVITPPEALSCSLEAESACLQGSYPTAAVPSSFLSARREIINVLWLEERDFRSQVELIHFPRPI